MPKVFDKKFDQRGTSVVIALTLVTAMMVFAIGIASTVVSTLKNTSNSKKAVQAEYIAQGGIEMVKYELSGMEVAEAQDVSGNIAINIVCDDEGTQGGEGDCYSASTGEIIDLEGVDDSQSIYARYEINTVDDGEETNIFGGYRAVPVIGTGSAGDNCEIYKHNMSVLNSDYQHPCNWNKIYYGESVDIPLYTVAGDGSVDNPSELGFYNYYIFVRTPCEDPNINSSSCSRFDVQTSSGSGFDKGYVVLNWQVNGDCNSYGKCSVVPKIDTNYTVQEQSIGSGIKLVSMKIAEVFDPAGSEGMLNHFLLNQSAWTENGLNKPVLKLSFIKEISDYAGISIPYLEYLFLYSSMEPLASAYTIDIEGVSEGFKYTLDGVQSINSGLFDFAVQN